MIIEPIIIITEPKLAKVIASVTIILRASLELATIRAGDFGAGGGTRSSGRVVYRTAGCGVEGGRAGSYPQHPPRGETTFAFMSRSVRRVWASGGKTLVKMSATLFLEATKTKVTCLAATCSRNQAILMQK